jgi:predicted metal-dependent phosphoesterase TrpH
MAERYLFDLHIHSTRSPDSRLSPRIAILRAREIGLSGIAFTDHDRLTIMEPTSQDLALVPGAELSTEWGDLLALGIRELPSAGLPVPELIAEIHRQGGVAVVPHPFSETLSSICMNEHVFDVIGMVDGLEVTSPKRSVDNRRARALAAEHRKAVVGGSDAHSEDGMGWGFTACEENTVEGLLRAIREGRTEAFIRKNP